MCLLYRPRSPAVATARASSAGRVLADRRCCMCVFDVGRSLLLHKWVLKILAVVDTTSCVVHLCGRDKGD